MAIFVVRHGQTEANASGLLLGRANPGLDAVGRDQAAAIGSALPVVGLAVTSPLDRCRQTAEIIAEAASIPEIRVDERLIELDYGELDLTPLREVPAEVWKAWQADAGYRPPGGESLQELASRVDSCLDELWTESAAGDIAVVTHVSPIKAAVAWALKVPIGISWRCRVSQASITKLGSGPGGPSLHSFNGTGHLDAD